MTDQLVGAIEAGGTKFVCALGTGPTDVRAEVRFPTTSPDETLASVGDFFRSEQLRHGAMSALGIGSFGPVDVRRDSPTWGFITSTPKPGWAGIDFAARLRRELGVPVGFDTDVNAAALGEWRWGAGRGLHSVVYVTVGTGIGGGGVVNGQPLNGLMHPEMGHVPVVRDPEVDPFPGTCPYHGDCLEGMASGQAMVERWGVPAEDLPSDHPAWQLEADYLASGMSTVILVLSPERLVVGGGVMQAPQLMPLVQERLRQRLGGYLQLPEILDGLDRYLVPPVLGHRAGILGAMVLAARALGGVSG
ncbi:MAG: ROK family protein [Gemmatimonadetes bacterium]|nr:ROK family protein [Gemmatimonadota bacterium]